MTIEAYTTNDEELLIPLLSKGIDIYFDSRTPTSHELDSCPYIHLTNVDQECNLSKIGVPNGETKNEIHIQ